MDCRYPSQFPDDFGVLVDFPSVCYSGQFSLVLLTVLISTLRLLVLACFAQVCVIILTCFLLLVILNQLSATETVYFLLYVPR